MTTGDHLLRTLKEGYWPVAGVDLFLLASAAVAATALRKLRRSAHAAGMWPKPATQREPARA